MRYPEIDALAALPVETVAEKIGIPLASWPGNCYAVAVALVKSGLMPAGTRAVYGHWRGEIAETSLFAGRRGLGFTGHGWTVTPTDRVVDPTRWAFEDVAPYVYIGPDPADDIEEVCRNCEHLVDEHEDLFGGRCKGGDDAGYDCGPCYFESLVHTRADAENYDEGGNQLATQNLRPFPTFDPDARTTSKEPPTPVDLLLVPHGYREGPLTVAQALWAANLPLDVLGPCAEPLYRWLDECGMAGLVPIDNRMNVLGGAPTAV